MTVAQLYTIPGLGKKSVNAIIETLAKFRNA
jgi:DNA uptake protein ComE-like DNA-binding protein